MPRDRGADWDFEDVRDHYLRTLFECDPDGLRANDHERYLELSRAVSCTLIEQAIGEWRRVGSRCWGALIWQLQDVAPGAGWGLIDSDGRRKPAWHAMRRASQPRQLILTDEGLNGLTLHVLNELDHPLHGIVRLTCLRDGSVKVREVEHVVTVEARGATLLHSADLLEAFFDISYAYRFGPRSHDVTIATLRDAADDSLIAEAFHLPVPGILPSRNPGLDVTVERHADDWRLRLCSRGFMQFLHIDDATFEAQDDWFHLAPDCERLITLKPGRDTLAIPRGNVRALNLEHDVSYAGEA